MRSILVSVEFMNEHKSRPSERDKAINFDVWRRRRWHTCGTERGWKKSHKHTHRNTNGDKHTRAQPLDVGLYQQKNYTINGHRRRDFITLASISSRVRVCVCVREHVACCLHIGRTQQKAHSWIAIICTLNRSPKTRDSLGGRRRHAMKNQRLRKQLCVCVYTFVVVVFMHQT